MANRKCTRVLEMRKNFLDLRKKGKSLSEIAEYYNLSLRTIYYELQAIADMNGISRKDLLENDYPETRMSPSKVSLTKKETVNIDEFESFSKDTIIILDNHIKNLENFLKETF